VTRCYLICSQTHRPAKPKASPPAFPQQQHSQQQPLQHQQQQQHNRFALQQQRHQQHRMQQQLAQQRSQPQQPQQQQPQQQQQLTPKENRSVNRAAAQNLPKLSLEEMIREMKDPLGANNDSAFMPAPLTAIVTPQVTNSSPYRRDTVRERDTTLLSIIR